MIATEESPASPAPPHAPDHFMVKALRERCDNLEKDLKDRKNQLRDIYAGIAMQAYIQVIGPNFKADMVESISSGAFGIANGMMKEREKHP